MTNALSHAVPTPARPRLGVLLAFAALATASCAHQHANYHSLVMDFGSIQKAAVLPFANLSSNQAAAERVRDVAITTLLATGALYILPPGEVARGASKIGLRDAAMPSAEEVVKLGQTLAVEAVFTGVVREYGEVRTGQASSNVIALSMRLHETQTGRIVWSCSVRKGGVGFWDRLLGGGGKAMNDVTQDAVEELVDALFDVPSKK